MVDIPAVCSTCGALFFAPNLVGGAGRVEFRDSRLNPCPACGGVGDVIDGVYDAATNTARLLIHSPIKFHLLAKLEQILRAAKKQDLSRDQVASRLEEEVSNLKVLGQRLSLDAGSLSDCCGHSLSAIGRSVLNLSPA